MADYLVYWKTFWEDNGNLHLVSADWNTSDTSFFNGIERDDTLWVVVRAAPKSSEWRLLNRIVVSARDLAPGDSKWGSHHVIGKPAASKVFNVYSQPNFEHVLRELEFSTGKRISGTGACVGQFIQAPRRLSERDGVFLAGYAAALCGL